MFFPGCASLAFAAAALLLFAQSAQCNSPTAEFSHSRLSDVWQAEFMPPVGKTARPAAPTAYPAYPENIHLRSDRPHPAVVRVIVAEQGATSYGSGTLVDVRDQFGMVITNWHVVRDAQGPIEVVFPDGFRSQARALKVDADWDLAALVIWRPRVQPVPIAATAPQPGDQLTICGYGQGLYRSATGRCTQYYAPRVDFPRQMVELDVQARQGDSGGPIFNQRGELAGVLFGAGQGTTLGSFGGRVGSFLATLAPDIGQATDHALVQGDFQNSARAPNVRSKGSDAALSGDKNAPSIPAEDAPWHAPQPHIAELWAAGDSASSSAAAVNPVVHQAPSDAQPPAVPTAVAGHEVAGNHWFDQAKTVLAAIGLLAIALQMLRVVR